MPSHLPNSPFGDIKKPCPKTMPTSQSLAYKWKIWLLQPIQFHKYTYWHGLHAPHESLRHRPWSCLLSTFWLFSYLICWFTYPFCSSNEYSTFFFFNATAILIASLMIYASAGCISIHTMQYHCPSFSRKIGRKENRHVDGKGCL